MERQGSGFKKITDAYYAVHNYREELAPKFYYDTVSFQVTKPQNDALDDALENRLIAIIKSNPKSTQNELAYELSISRATVQRLCRDLRKRGIIERKGGRRHGYWEVQDV